jgi:hypothetical protein
VQCAVLDLHGTRYRVRYNIILLYSKVGLYCTIVGPIRRFGSFFYRLKEQARNKGRNKQKRRGRGGGASRKKEKAEGRRTIKEGRQKGCQGRKEGRKYKKK